MSTDVIIAAARASVTPDFSSKNADNLAALEALLDAGEAVAQAINDNAMDDRRPVDHRLAVKLQIRAWRIARLVIESSQVLDVMPRV